MAVSTIDPNGLNVGQLGGTRNLIINGSMQVAQRGSSTAGVTTQGYYSPDRFNFIINTAGTWTVSQASDGPSGFAKSYGLSCTTADASLAAGDYVYVSQILEGQNLQQLKKGTADAVSVTLSFWVKSSKTGTYTVELRDVDNSRHIASTYTVSSANTWEYKTITFAGDTTGAFTNDNNASLYVNFWLGAGTDYTSGTLATSWQSLVDANRVSSSNVNLADSTSNNFYLTGVQLEIGDTATDFENELYGTTFQKCQRYFQRSWHTASNSGNSQTYPGAVTGVAQDTGSFNVAVQFRTQLRATPTFTFYRDGVAGRLWNVDTAGTVTASLSQSWYDINGINGMAVSGGVLTANVRYGFDYDVDSEL